MRAWTRPRPAPAEPVLSLERAGSTVRVAIACSRCHAVVAQRGARLRPDGSLPAEASLGARDRIAWLRHECPAGRGLRRARAAAKRPDLFA